MKHIWKSTGEDLSAATDPPTTRERCETCGSLCWHYHGINDVRFRRARDKVGKVTPEDMLTPHAPVLDDEPCAGRLLSPEEALHIPNPQTPLPAPRRSPGEIVAGPRKLNARYD